MTTVDTVRWRAHATVDKWNPDQLADARLGDLGGACTSAMLWQCAGPPADTITARGNMLLDAGKTRIYDLLRGTGQALEEDAVRIGVGSSATAEAANQTDLQGGTDKWFQPMDTGYPQIVAGVLTFRSTFGTDDANFEWAEWGLDVDTPPRTAGATAGAVLFNRRAVPLGTKAPGSIWTLTTTITVG